MTNNRLLIRNVRRPDDHSLVDILCDGETIAEVGFGLEIPEDAARRIDGGGGLALPAFFDVHSHADCRAWYPDISHPKMTQGIAIEVVGNCGLGPAPASTDPGWQAILGGVMPKCPELPPDYSFRTYLHELRTMNDQVWPTPFSLVPFGAVRASVAGLKRVLDDQESAWIRVVIEEALSAGALGVSLGLVYPPNDAATESELIAALQPLAGSTHILAVHVRSQANYWIEAIEEVLRLAASIRCRLLISHLCIGGGRNQWKAKWVLARLLRARDEGMDVWFDQHPYSAGSTSLTQLLPPWALRSGPCGVELDVAPDELAQLLEVPSVSAGWENYVELIGPENILFAGSSRSVDFVGKTLADLRDEWNVSLVGTLVRILEMTEGSSTIVLLNLYEPDTIALIAATEFGCFSTDSVHSTCPHPRLYGTYPYAFRHLVSTGRLTESEFVRRSAQVPTEIMRFSRKAVIDKGGEADFLVVDTGQLNHSADYLNPSNPVTGIKALILGGELVSYT